MTRTDTRVSLFKIFDNVCENIETSYKIMGQIFDRHPTVYKIAVVAMHLMRAISMAALMSLMPFHPMVNFTLSLVASEIYRIVIERHCAFKFAQLSCLGGEAILLSHYSLQQIVQLTALETFKRVSFTLLGTIPLGVYLGSVIAVSTYDVNKKLKGCCTKA